MAKLSIETLPDTAEGLGSNAIAVEGSSADIMQAWLYLTWALAKTLEMPTEALLFFGLAQVEQTTDNIVEAVCIDQGRIEGK